jgi:hypothetical protein
VAARSMAWTVFACSNAGIVGSNPTNSMDFCVYSVFALGSGLVTGWSLVRGVLPNVLAQETEVKRSISQLPYTPSGSNRNISQLPYAPSGSNRNKPNQTFPETLKMCPKMGLNNLGMQATQQFHWRSTKWVRFAVFSCMPFTA